MTYYTPVTNGQKEIEILEFLKKLSQDDSELEQDLRLQFIWIMHNNTNYHDYYLHFDDETCKLFATSSADFHINTKLNLTTFLATIEKTINTLNKEKSMRQLTLENYKTLTQDEVIIVYQNKNSILEVKPLMMMVTETHEMYSTSYGLNYGFMNIANPLVPAREFKSNNKLETIRAAIESGNDVYVAESINKIFFSGEKGQQPLPVKEITTKVDSGHIAQIEAYIHYLLRQHTEYLIAELGMTQYPKETYRETTEVFLIEKLK